MPAPYGVTPTGFSTPTEEELLALIEADQRSELSATLDLSGDSTVGQINRILARHLHEAWLALEASYHSFDPHRASADSLTSLSKVTGTGRRGPSYSQVDLTVRLLEGTKLEAGTHFAHVIGKPDLRFTPLETITALDDGTFTRRWRAENAGPIDAGVDTIVVIATPVVGWEAITASGEVEVGRLVDTDADLRIRREQGLARTGGATLAALRSDLLALPTVTNVQVFENSTDYTDANGMPPHSFEAIVTAANATDDEIAQAIWDSRPAGVQPIGTTSGTALDRNGDQHVMPFSRPRHVEIWITYQVAKREGDISDDELKATIAGRLDAELQAGDAVTLHDAWDATHGLGIKIGDVTFGTAPAPTSSADLPITPREIARFDARRIVLVDA